MYIKHDGAVKTEGVMIPHGILVVTTDRGRRIFIRVKKDRVN